MLFSPSEETLSLVTDRSQIYALALSTADLAKVRVQLPHALEHLLRSIVRYSHIVHSLLYSILFGRAATRFTSSVSRSRSTRHR